MKQTFYFSFIPLHLRAAILALIAFALYFNSSWNKYVLDDGLLIHENPVTQSGFKGLGTIFTSDAYSTYYTHMNSKSPLTGGRYRPLSIATFAIEWQFFGLKVGDGVETENASGQQINGTVSKIDYGDVEVTYPGADGTPATVHKTVLELISKTALPFVSHFINVLLYALTIFFLYRFTSRFLFPTNPDLSFLVVLLFAIHPIHTEVVANIKSRDEILSFLFIILALHSLFIFYEGGPTERSWTHGILSMLWLFLALLSKEYALITFIIFPVLIWVFANWNRKSLYRAMAVVTAVTALYLVIRFSILNTFGHHDKGIVVTQDVLNVPYMYATSSQALATKFFVLGKYLWLSFLPVHLSYDYSYNQIAYRSFSDPRVALSIILYLGLAIGAIMLLIKKHPLSFAILFYLGNLALVSNFTFNIGATMGERFLYHSSFGFAIALGWFILYAIEKRTISMEGRRNLFLVLVGVLFIGASVKTIARNAEWKDQTTLFIHDVAVVPNSSLANSNAGSEWINKANKLKNDSEKTEGYNKAVAYLQKAILIHPKYVAAYLNLGVAYFQLSEFDLAKQSWDEARKLYPTHPKLAEYDKMMDPKAIGFKYRAMGNNLGIKKDFKGAEEALKKSVQYNPDDADAWYDLGGASFSAADYQEAYDAWQKCLQIDPSYQKAQQGMAALQSMIK